MMATTRQEIVAVLGPVDDEFVSELMGTEASAEELREAWGWLNNDEALMGAGRPLQGDTCRQAARNAGAGRRRALNPTAAASELR